MKRILSHVLALVLVFGIITPALAEAATDSQAGKDLKSYGIIVGTEKGLDEITVLTRAMMATILANLYGKKAEAATYATPSSFTDVPEGEWFSKFIAFAEQEGWMVGDGEGLTFRPNDTMTAQEVNSTYLRALGYDIRWEEVNAKATELKMAVVPKDTEKVLRGEAFSALRAALDVSKCGRTEALGTTLALTGFVASTTEVPEVLVENPKPVKRKKSSSSKHKDTKPPTAWIEVQADNKLVITFSKAMADNIGSIIVKDKNAKVLGTKIVNGLGTWNARKTVLTLTAVQLDTSTFKLSDTNSTDIKIELKDMKDATTRGNQLAASEIFVTLLDTMNPVIQDKYTTNAGSEVDKSDDTVTFYFSEMMDEDSLGNLSNYLSSTTSFDTIVGVSIKSIATDKRSVTITYPDAVVLLNGFLTVVNVTDSAGNVAPSKFDVAMGSTATELTYGTGDIAIAESTQQITVKFSLAIKTIDPAAITILNGDGSVKTTVYSIAKIDDDTVTLNLVDPLDGDCAKYQVNIEDKTLITSNYDTMFDSLTVKTAIKDLIAPRVVSFHDGEWLDKIVAKNNHAILTFSEAIDDTKEFTNVSGLHSALTIKITEGSEVQILDSKYYSLAVDNSKKSLEIILDSTIPGLTSGTKTLEVKLNNSNANLVDVAGNMMLPFTKSISDFNYGYSTPSATAEYQDNDNNGEIDRIVVTATGGNITEAVQSDFILGGETSGDDLTITGMHVLGNAITFDVTGQANVTLTDDTMAWTKGAFKVNGVEIAERIAAVMSDKATPKVKSITAASSNDVNTLAKKNDIVTYTFNFTEPVTVSDVTATTFSNASGVVTSDLDASEATSDTISVTVNAADNGDIDIATTAFTITDASANVQTYTDRVAVKAHVLIPLMVKADTIAPAVTLDITNVNGILVNKAAKNITITAVGEFEVGLVLDATKITIDTNDDDDVTPNVTLTNSVILSVESNGNSVTISLGGDVYTEVDTILAAFNYTNNNSVDFAPGWLKDAVGNEIPVNGVGTTPKGLVAVN